MRTTKMFLPTLKDAPSDAEVVSHKLMVRAGMIRKVASGIYNILPLGVKVINKVSTIVREELSMAGAQEVSMPFILPSELWKESGRWDVYGNELLRFKDRHERDFCLGPTHEEAITDMVRKDVRSYKELPLNLYQIQTKFRDEIRPRFGLMRGREFIMKDGYSFHSTEECAEREYRNMYETYTRIFSRCDLSFRIVEAETGPIGGSFSHEFMVLAPTGEGLIATCKTCSYAANTERAEIRKPERPSRAGKIMDLTKNKPLKTVNTPAMKTVEEVSAFLNIPPSNLIKTIIYSTENGIVCALVRGDSEINEAKLKRVLNVAILTMADPAAVKKATGAEPGFAGPVGLKLPIFADYGINDITSGVTGANESDKHIINVSPERDFTATYADIRIVKHGDPCPRCNGTLELTRGIEVGHIFKLGTKYSESMKAMFLDEFGAERPVIMGCYGIGIGRTVAAAIEGSHDEKGIVWQRPLSPFDCHIVAVNVKDEAIVKAADALYECLTKEGFDVLYDDRDQRAGVKFNDADLIGVSVRITVSNKTLKEDSIEIKERKSPNSRLVKTADALGEIGRLAGKN